ncbi:hypothetical protein ACIHCQ_20820 [Streptomyces sp. NPDC052236]|uniref:hypothetical protein n=1 Tax=Streptomyces sp. NPDC052236 TaxID=3365686 RepID=UPI0037D01E78
MEPVRFAVLGPVLVQRAGVELPLGRPQERALLALLLARGAQPVAVKEMVDVPWGGRPPHSAVNVIRRNVGSLRRLLEPGLPTRAVSLRLIRDAGGYRLAADGDSLDPMLLRIQGMGKLRYVVEQPFSLLHQFKRLAVRWERRTELHDAFVSLACSLVCWRRLKKRRP